MSKLVCAIVFLISEAHAMFWSGKKKQKTSPERTEDPRAIVANALADMLTIQMTLAPIGEFEVTKIELVTCPHFPHSNLT